MRKTRSDPSAEIEVGSTGWRMRATLAAGLDRERDLRQPRGRPCGSEEAHFWRHCSYAVRSATRSTNHRTGGGTHGRGEGEAPRLPGFEHLRMYYLVKRGDEEIGVTSFDLTDREFDERAALLR